MGAEDERRVQKKGQGCLNNQRTPGLASLQKEALKYSSMGFEGTPLLPHPYILRRERDQLYDLQRTLCQPAHDSDPSAPNAYRSYEVKAGPALGLGPV